jgi:hypothetical protein
MSQRNIRTVYAITDGDCDFANIPWSATYSPLRVVFIDTDPTRRGRGLHGYADAELGVRYKTPLTVIDNASMTPDLAVYSRQSWRDTLRLIYRATEQGIIPYFDDDMDLVISGFELLDAGLISTNVDVTCDLTDTEKQQCREPEDAVVEVMEMYIHNLESHNHPYLNRAMAWFATFMKLTGKRSPHLQITEIVTNPPASNSLVN